MPESKSRQSRNYVAPTGKAAPLPPSPTWYVWTMLGLMILGLIWIVVFYLSGSSYYPVPKIGLWNIVAGFGLLLTGLAMMTRWR